VREDNADMWNLITQSFDRNRLSSLYNRFVYFLRIDHGFIGAENQLSKNCLNKVSECVEKVENFRFRGMRKSFCRNSLGILELQTDTRSKNV
jgi:hypothetical protein